MLIYASNLPHCLQLSVYDFLNLLSIPVPTLLPEIEPVVFTANANSNAIYLLMLFKINRLRI